MMEGVEAQFAIKPECLIGDVALDGAGKGHRAAGAGVGQKPSAITTVFRATISTGLKRLGKAASRSITHCAAWPYQGTLRN